jgi:molybdopterin molybdotransferase
MLAGLLEQDGAVATELGHLPDDEDLLLDALAGAAGEHDLLITAGGISAGAYEVVRQALTPLGCMRFLNVAMSPGSPQGLGVLGTTPVLALPGNPTAALVSYLVFGRPLLRGCQGYPDPMPPWFPMALAAPLARRGEGTRFIPGLLNRGGGTVLGGLAESGHRLTAFAGADCLLRVDPGEGLARGGDAVPVLAL